MLREGTNVEICGARSRQIVKQLSPKLDKATLYGKFLYVWAVRRLLILLDLIIRLFIRAYRWLDKPHTLRIKKKTIIIGALILFLTYQLFVPHPQRIVYAGSNKGPISPLIIKITQLPILPQTHLQPIQTVQAVYMPPTLPPAPISQSSTNNIGGIVPNCGDNTYANYIYMHESGCSTTIVNYLGCVGIGQACPGSKLYVACPNLDYACENAYFTAYAAKYGGWYGSYLFWTQNHWW